MPSTSSVLAAKPSAEALHIGLKTSDRQAIARALGDILSATYRLLIKTHVHHWNVVGPLFHPLHLMTEAQYEDLFAAADVIAERIRALGQPAPVPTIEMKGNPADIALLSAAQIVEDLVNDNEAIVRAMRDAAEQAEQARDAVSHDLLVARMNVHEKAVWMLRAVIAS